MRAVPVDRGEHSSHHRPAANGRVSFRTGQVPLTQQEAKPYMLVDDASSFDQAASDMSGATRLAVDTEADSRHHYPEKVCLIQVATPQRAYLIDSLAALDVSPLGNVLADPDVEKVLHGADFDLRGLNRDFGFTTRSLYDTNVAAMFAGLDRFALAALIEDLLVIVIHKDQRLQRADRSRRPLRQ